jgi:chromosome segregation protein
VQLLFADASSGARSPALVRQGQIGEIVNAKPESRRRILEEAAGIAGLHARRHEAETRLKGADTNLTRLQDVIGQIAGQIDGLKRQARQAVRYKKVSGEVRRYQSMLIALRWRDAEAAVAEAERVEPRSARSPSIRASNRRRRAAACFRRGAGPLREAEAVCGAALQRLNLARTELDREEARAKARTEDLDRRLVQLAQDLERERALAKDAAESTGRLEGEERALAETPETSAAAADTARDRLSDAEITLAASEKSHDVATTALADLVARREQLDRAIAEWDERLKRVSEQIAALEREEIALDAAESGALENLRMAVNLGQEKLAAADAAMLRAEAGRSAAAQELDAIRKPLTDSERRLHRLETEARTLAKLLDVATKSLWPPVLDTIVVEPGFEAALGAALGDDLDAPADSASPMHWAGAEPKADDPALPAGTVPLSSRVKAPGALARRLAQIGIVARADGGFARRAAPGQRRVSKEATSGWDGTVAADARPASRAARRPQSSGRDQARDRAVRAEVRDVRPMSKAGGSRRPKPPKPMRAPAGAARRSRSNPLARR